MITPPTPASVFINGRGFLNSHIMNIEYFDALLESTIDHTQLTLASIENDVDARDRMFQIVFESFKTLSRRVGDPVSRAAIMALIETWEASERDYRRSIMERNRSLQKNRRELLTQWRKFRTREIEFGLSIHKNQVN